MLLSNTRFWGQQFHWVLCRGCDLRCCTLAKLWVQQLLSLLPSSTCSPTPSLPLHHGEICEAYSLLELLLFLSGHVVSTDPGETWTNSDLSLSDGDTIRSEYFTLRDKKYIADSASTPHEPHCQLELLWGRLSLFSSSWVDMGDHNS